MKERPRTAPAGALAVVLALTLAACGDDAEGLPPHVLATPVRVSGTSPFSPGCEAPDPAGTRYADSEVEPHLAIHPLNPDHLVAAWQQDRWSSGGADGIVAALSLDGGATWRTSPLPFSRCGGGAAPGGDYERATDPWLAFSSDGAVVYAVALALDASTPRNAIVASRSTDGGLTWEPARVLAADAARETAVDKPTITADPARAGYVYAVWDRLTGIGGPIAESTGPAWLSRSTDGGLTWEAPRVIHDPGLNAQTIASQIVVLPDGALVNVLVRILGGDRRPAQEILAMRSEDAGATWAAPVSVGTLEAIGAADPEDGEPIRGGEVVPSSAVDGGGRIWVAWQDARFSGGVRDGVVLAVSQDGGLGWSAPVLVNRAPSAQAFRPAVAASAAGAVAVTYYDLRADVPGDPRRMWAAVWRATSTDGGATWAEIAEGGPFDLRRAPQAQGWFLGDYTGLVARREGFAALFSMSRSALGTGTDAFTSGAPLPAAAFAAASPPQRNARPVAFAERLRASRERPSR